MTIGKARIKLPASARAGEVITIRALIQHAMESGYRHDASGAVIPRRIIHDFKCFFDDELVIAVELGPGVAANPYFEFDVVVTRSGRFRFIWTEDGGATAEAEADVTVT